jgi:ABC-2 type transport system permease protein
MKNSWIIARKELRTYFTAPMAFVVIIIFSIIIGFFFWSILMWFNNQAMQMAQNQYYYSQININQMVYQPLFNNMSIILLFMLPGLTMRLFSEEKKIGTEELLFTSPISVWQIIFGKFVAALFVLLGMLGLTAFLSVFAFLYGNPEVVPILLGYIGLFLMGAAFIAIGIFFSSLSKSQTIAAALTFGALLMFWVINWASNFAEGFWKDVLNYLSFFQHFNNMTLGILDTIDVIYYLSFVILGLFLTHWVIQSRGRR